MKSLILFLALATSTLQGSNAQIQPFIIGGEDITHGEFPFLVSIRAREGVNNGFVCGGTLIDKNAVITVASCLYASPDTPRYPLNAITVTAGDHTLEKVEEDEQTSGLTKIILHPQFSLTGEKEDVIATNDIAILVTTESFVLNDKVQLATLYNAPIGQTVGTVVGWGLRDGGQLNPHLPPQKVQLTVANNAACAERYEKNGFNPSLQFCAGSENKGVCLYDHGGPFVVGNNKVFEGIITSILPGGEDANCARDSTGTPFIRVTSYASWIAGELGIPVNPPPTNPPPTNTPPTNPPPTNTPPTNPPPTNPPPTNTPPTSPPPTNPPPTNTPPTNPPPTTKAPPDQDETGTGLIIKSQSFVIYVAFLVGVWLLAL